MIPRRGRRWSTALLWWALAAAGPGCGFGSEAGSLIYNACASDADCGQGECNDGICIATSVQSMEVALEVVPASGSLEGAAGSWVFDPMTITGATVTGLTMETRLSVSGDVTSGGVLVPCDVSFTRPSRLPGAPDVMVHANAPDYHVELVAGQRYDVVVQPLGQAMAGTGVSWLSVLPPLYYTFDAPTADPQNPGAVLITDLPIDYPTLDTFDGVVVDLSDSPEPGLQVRAVEKATGRSVSSVGATGSDGSFSLAVLPSAGAYVLRVSGGPSRPNYPTVEIDPALLFPGTPSVLRIPALQPVAFAGVVEDGHERPIQNALVELRSTALSGLDVGTVASFRASVTSSGVPGDVGTFEVEVLPGAYDVIVTPSGTVCATGGCTSAEGLGVLASSVVIDGPQLGRLLVVPDRARLGGRVLTDDGRTMRDMPVQAVSRQIPLPGDPSVAASYNRSSSSSTDATGRFDLRLDLGVYDLFVKPPTESSFPWVVVPTVEAATLGAPMAASYTMSLPVPLRGVVSTASGDPLDAAEVRAHAIITEGGTTRAIMIGSATTGASGAFELLLPSQL